MQSRIPTLGAIAMILTQAAFADLTIHYKSTFYVPDTLTPAVADAMKRQMGSTLPPETTVFIKGDRVFTIYGSLTMIVDYTSGKMTLLDVPGKRCASIPAADYPKQIEAMMPSEARAALKDMNAEITADKSGKTAVIHGLPAEETVVTLSLSIPTPNGVPVRMRMELHNWMATQQAIANMPELKQWDGKRWSSIGGVNISEMMTATFAQGPAAEKLRAAMRNMIANYSGLPLKTESRIMMPTMSQMPKAQGVGTGDGPVVETVMEVDTISSAPIADAQFQIPAGYKEVPFADLLRELSPAKPKVPGQ